MTHQATDRPEGERPTSRLALAEELRAEMGGYAAFVAEYGSFAELVRRDCELPAGS
jgi:hypothetical protein